MVRASPYGAVCTWRFPYRLSFHRSKLYPSHKFRPARFALKRLPKNTGAVSNNGRTKPRSPTTRHPGIAPPFQAANEHHRAARNRSSLSDRDAQRIDTAPHPPLLHSVRLWHGLQDVGDGVRSGHCLENLCRPGKFMRGELSATEAEGDEDAPGLCLLEVYSNDPYR